MTINLRKILRYGFMFFLSYIAISSVSYGKLDTKDILTIAMFIMICFLFMDLYYPIVIL